jgi:hypothetical protein
MLVPFAGDEKRIFVCMGDAGKLPLGGEAPAEAMTGVANELERTALEVDVTSGPRQATSETGVASRL